MTRKDYENIIIFDGECNLCNGVIGWLIKYTPEGLFKFVAFQSHYGQALLIEHGLPSGDLDSVVIIDETGLKTDSDGFLKILSKIPKWKHFASLLSYIPKLIRDNIYKIASKNRVKWFGQSKSCIVDI